MKKTKKIPAQKFKNGEHICPKCDCPDLKVIPESQASALLQCLSKKCGYVNVILF